MSIPVLPPPVDLDADTKKSVIDGLKRVLTAFQSAGYVDKAITYQALISDPDVLYAFIQTFIAHREAVDAIVKPREGTAPVRDDDQILVCNVSLNQIQHLLVRTCARKAMELNPVIETVTKTVTTTKFLFLKKTEQVEVQQASTDPLEVRKAREISKYMAFTWQLPLVKVFQKALNSAQLMEISECLVALQSAADIEAIAQYDSAILKKARAAAGQEFADVLASQPHAVLGIATWNHDMYTLFRSLLGDKAWVFFARDSAFFNTCAALDKYSVKVLGDMLCYIATENLSELQRLNVDKIEVMVTGLRSAFGKDLVSVLKNPNFAKEYLRKMVDNLLHMTQEKDKLMAAYAITLKSMVPTVREWMVQQIHK